MQSLDEIKEVISRGLLLRVSGEAAAADARLGEAYRDLQAFLHSSPDDSDARRTLARLQADFPQGWEASARVGPPWPPGSADAAMREDLSSLSAPELGDILETPSPVSNGAGVEPPVPPHTSPDVSTGADAVPAVPAVRPQGTALPEDLRWAAARLRLKSGDVDSAEQELKAGLTYAPEHAGILASLADLLLQQQRYSDAETVLVDLSKVDPEAAQLLATSNDVSPRPERLALQAALYRRTGDLQKAEEALRRAIDLEPGQPKWVVALADVMLAQNKAPEAEAVLDAGLGRGLDESSVHLAYARAAASMAAFDVADAHLRMAERANPADQDALDLRKDLQPSIDVFNEAYRHMALAKLRSEEGRTDEAVKNFESALKRDPHNLPSLRAYALFLEEQKDYRASVQKWALLGTIRPVEATEQLQRILLAQGEDPTTLREMARVLTELGRHGDAAEYAQRSWEGEPENAETLDVLTAILERQARRLEAEQELFDHPQLVKTNARLSLRLARLLALRGRYDLAISHFERAAELAPDDSEITSAVDGARERNVRFHNAYLNLAYGMHLENEGQPQEAEPFFRAALEDDPEHVLTLRHYAEYLEHANRTIEAGDLVVRLGRIDPTDAKNHYVHRVDTMSDPAAARCAFGALLMSLNEPQEAMNQYGLALQAAPGYLPALLPYFDALLEADRLAEAESALQNAMAVEPNAAELLWRSGKLLLLRHRPERARVLLERADAISSAPQFQDALDMVRNSAAMVEAAELDYAWARELLRHDPGLADGERILRSALDQWPDHVPSLVDLGRFLYGAGRRQEALGFARRAIALDPLEPDAITLLEDLQGLKDEGVVGTAALTRPVASDGAEPVTQSTTADTGFTPSSDIDGGRRDG